MTIDLNSLHEKSEELQDKLWALSQHRDNEDIEYLYNWIHQNISQLDIIKSEFKSVVLPVEPKPKIIKLSEHLSDIEVRCRHCGKLPDGGMSSSVIALFEKIRQCAGDHPISILSGYRCPEHNKAIGGATKSQHMLGAALDIHCRKIPTKHLWEVCTVVVGEWGGVGFYGVKAGNFGHIDSRGSRARWEN